MSSGGARTATRRDPSRSRQAPREARTAISPQVRLRGASRTHPAAERLSRNARRPSWPSGLVRSRRRAAAAPRRRGALRGSAAFCRTRSRPGLSSGRSPATARRCRVERRRATSWTSPIRESGLGVEALARQEVAPRRAGRSSASTNGEMTAGTIPSLTSVKPKTASGRRNRDVGAGDEPGAAAQRVAVHAHDHGAGQRVDRLAASR